LSSVLKLPKLVNSLSEFSLVWKIKYSGVVLVGSDLSRQTSLREEVRICQRDSRKLIKLIYLPDMNWHSEKHDSGIFHMCML